MAPRSRRVLASVCALVTPALLECAPLIGLDEDYYVAGGSAGRDQGGAAGTAGGAAGGSGGGGAPSAGSGAGGEPEGGAAGAGAIGGAGGEGGLTLPSGKLVFHRYTSYASGDSEMFLVDFPDGPVSQELGELYGLCNLLNGIFSPDGRKLAVAAQPRVEPCGPTAPDQLDVYLLDLENPPEKFKVTENALPDEDPQFSIDGTFLLFKHNLHLAKWDISDAAFTSCDALGPGSFCFTPWQNTTSQQSKPVQTPDQQSLCYYELFGPDADIRCVDLDAALAGEDITVTSTPVVAHDDVSDARPIFSDRHLYYVRWRSKDNIVDQIARRPIDNLLGVDDYPAFTFDNASDYSDPFNLGGELVVFSSDISGLGQHDLFVAEWGSAEVQSLDDWIPGINSVKDDLGSSFWFGP